VKLQKLGCSVLAKSSKQLKLAVQRIEEQKQLFKSKADTVNRFAGKFKGLDRAVEVIESNLK
jgi:hypothetical protein